MWVSLCCPARPTAAWESVIVLPSFLPSISAMHMALPPTRCGWVLTAAQVTQVLPLSSQLGN